MTLWAVLFCTVCYIWVGTLVDTHIWWELFRVVAAVIVVPSILLLEAMAMALIELEDKALPTKIGPLDTRRVLEIRATYLPDMKRYLRAREWVLAALIVGLTIVVEFEKYFIWGLGRYEGVLARTAITVALATVAVIWIAQSPGKGVGKDKPVTFLNLPIGPKQMNRLILWVADRIDSAFLDSPSDGVAYLLNGLVQGSEPELGPGGPRLFAEIIRRYGYGECQTIENYTISDDGSATLIQKEITYIGEGRYPSHIRYIEHDKPPVSEPVVLSKAAFVVKTLGADVERDMRLWKDRDVMDVVLDREIRDDVDWKPDSLISTITVNLPNDFLKTDQAFVLELTTKTELPPGTFKSPENPGKDRFHRTLLRPCYKAETNFVLNSVTNRGLFDIPKFEVYQDDRGIDRFHTNESLRFKTEQEWDPKSERQRTWRGVSKDGRHLCVILSEGLPGAKYVTTWEMTNASSVRVNTQEPPVPPPVMQTSKAESNLVDP